MGLSTEKRIAPAKRDAGAINEYPVSGVAEAIHLALGLEAIAHRYGLTFPVFRDACGDEWPLVLDDMDLAGSAANAIAARLDREQGRIPLDYPATTICAECGPVHIFEGVPDRVRACPWCHIREAGLPVPSRRQRRL